MSEAGWIMLVIAIPVVLGLLWLAESALGVAIGLFKIASEWGFVGIAIYVACWVFMFPIMVAVCLIGAVWVLVASKREDDIWTPNPLTEEQQQRRWQEQDARYEKAKAELIKRGVERQDENG